MEIYWKVKWNIEFHGNVSFYEVFETADNGGAYTNSFIVSK